MEQRNTQYIPTINNDGEVVVNGNVLRYVEKDRKKFLQQIEVSVSKFKAEAYSKTSSPAEYKKVLNKMICDELGISLPYLHKWVNGLWYKTQVVPVEEYSRLFRAKSINTSKLRQVKKNKPLLDAAVADDQTHLLPIINAMGKSAEELRKEFGKGVWKKLCGNSFHRNNVIANAASRCGSWGLSEAIMGHVDIPTTLIQSGFSHSSKSNDDIIQFLIHSCKGYWGNKKELRKLYDTARDTINQCYRLSVPFNPKWSIRRMKEEHDKNTQIELAKKYTKETFPIFSDKNYPEQFEHEGLVAHLLMSPYDMRMEGQKQKHCVAGYSSSVANGDYLVYSVRDKEGNTLSTIGLSANTKEYPWRIHQHYAACNQQPSDECKYVAGELCSVLNAS